MIEKEYIVRQATSSNDEAAELTLPIGWKRYHKVQFGDKLKILADGFIVILPPNTSEKEEEKARDFLEGKQNNEHKYK
jgi:bifunctional DNA-binding transcriptional regulator/antitoxin component of YhaV-PrlF toxin-antitoxin module